jgi:hypothetical protein
MMLGTIVPCTAQLNSCPSLQLPVEEACRQCRHEWMRDVLRVWAAREGWTGLDLGTPARADVGRTPVQPVNAVTA